MSDGWRWWRPMRSTQKTSSRLKCSLRRKWKIRIRFPCIYFKSDIISQKLIGICKDTLPTNVGMTAKNRGYFFGFPRFIIIIIIDFFNPNFKFIVWVWIRRQLSQLLLAFFVSVSLHDSAIPPPPPSASSIWYVFISLCCFVHAPCREAELAFSIHFRCQLSRMTFQLTLT